MLGVIRITELADEMAEVDWKAEFVKVTFKPANVWTVDAYVSDHVIYKGVPIDFICKFQCSASICGLKTFPEMF
mgnify:CR=1 FL=1